MHVAAVITSGSLFLLRGLAVQAKARWPMAAPVRWLSYAIDSVLLTAALLLLTILPSAVYANGWLTVKLSLLVLYIHAVESALKVSTGLTNGGIKDALLARGQPYAIDAFNGVTSRSIRRLPRRRANCSS